MDTGFRKRSCSTEDGEPESRHGFRHHLARRPAGDASRPAGLGLIENGAVAARDGRIAFAGPMAELPPRWDAAREISARRPLDHARPDRLPHASRLRRRSRGRIRAAAGGRELRGDRARRRRHRLDREGDARGERGRAGRGDACRASIALIAEGVTTVEIKSGYGLDARRGAACCAPRAGSARARRRRRHHVPRRACAAAGSDGDKDALHRRGRAR